MRTTVVGTAILLGLGTVPHASQSVPLPAHASAERVTANDNRAPAGTVRAGTFTVRLEVREGEWRPDRETDAGVRVRAFAEEGKPLQVPGPLIRVIEGTEIRASIRNALGDGTLIVHGLHTRGGSAASDTVHVPAGGVRELRFVAGPPGTYYYWGTTRDVPGLDRRGKEDSQLSGALVVDPRGPAPSAPDRVFVMGRWGEPVAAGVPDNSFVRLVINGKAWPNTEALDYAAGDSIRWRIINATGMVHPMHLHGFYFRVLSRGNQAVDSVFAEGSAPRMVVTDRMAPFVTMSMLWVPERPGNWLFHCHDNVHIVRNPPLPGAPPAPVATHHTVDHAREMMGGLVMGVHVRPRGSMRVTSEPAAVRRLRLIARVDTGGTDREPAYGFALEEPGRPLRPATLLPGPTIVLKRGEPVSITVVNELPEATAIHWHGMELQSYFDGVADFAGHPGRIAPAIAPRDSFEARFTPPRAGTFMYHTHVDEVRQQKAGLSGAMLVLDPAATHDPATDLTFLITTPRLEANSQLISINGSLAPPPIEMRAGVRYRLRVLNLHTFRPSMLFEVWKDSALVSWRAVAKDGAELPAPLATVRPSRQQLGNGETYDFELVPAVSGEMRITVRAAAGALLASIPIRVR